MPRRKAQGINLQKRSLVVKSQNAPHCKKSPNFEKTKETSDCIKQSPIKTPNRVPEFTPVSPNDRNVETPNDSYLHKKFKKVAGICDSIVKTEKTETKIQNGFLDDAKRTESCKLELVPNLDDRKSSRCNLDVKNENNNTESTNVYKNAELRQSSSSPSWKNAERTRSPLMKKEDVHLSVNPGRYVCPYCQLACAKPSVLQKHIRAHTNERPYPCSPCGFAFKTKSNLYKHCRSQAHRVKTGEGQTGSEKCDSVDDMSDDSNSNSPEMSCFEVKNPPGYVQKSSKGSDTDTSENQYKIYKPKFHKATLYQDEKEPINSEVKLKIQEGIFEKQKKMEVEEKKEKPQLKITTLKEMKPGVQSPIFPTKSLPPSPEFLDQHISKIISDNQAIVETMEPQWTKKFLQRQNSREKEMSSPLSNVSNVSNASNVSSPGLEHYQKFSPELKKKDDTKSKLALALLKVDKNELNRCSMSYPKLEVNLDNQTYQPLNLTKKDSEEKGKYQTSGGSMIKEILIMSREFDSKLGQYSPETMAEMLSTLERRKEEVYQCTRCKMTYNSLENMNVHQKYYCHERSPEREVMSVEAPYLSPGPLLGTTPLVDVKTDTGPPPKKRRIQSTTIPPDENLLYSNRRLSTSSLPSSNGLAKSPNRPSSSPSTTLKSLEELSKFPMKPSSLNMFGGEVKILDCGETKTMRIESNPNPKSPMEPSEESPKFFVTIAKTGLHSGGGALVHVPASTTQTNSFQMASILSYPDTTKLLMPLVPNISTPNLTVPGVPAPNLNSMYNFDKTSSKDAATHNGGILTIVHGGKQIPYVPGIPGPQSVLPTKLTENSVKKEEHKKPKETKSTVSSLISVRKLSSSNQQKNVPNEIPKIEISAPKLESADSKKDDSKKEPGLKFLRPTSLPLRPGSFTPKRLHQGITPTVLSLVSPETPRPKKSYGQLFLNGHAYTYLGLKCSTRSYYCTISRPQPMYVAQSPQHLKLSMYSNWKVYSEAEPSLLGLTPAKAMAHYDSRHRSSTYVIADKNRPAGPQGILTHSSSWFKSSDKPALKDDSRTEATENSSWTGETAPKRVKIFAGGYESNEDYTYVRGRGRGRYVCEECGIRCKKPSMLKKHIRTHTDVRPYTCKHCTFSFKTKGNLTKHMKSKAHYKKCMEMNISPIPTTVEAENIDEELLMKQQAMRQDCNEDSENEEDEEEDESDGGDEEETTTEDPESLEREAACSLLSLSETTSRSSQFKSLYVAAGLIPKNGNSIRPSTYPYTTAKKSPPEVPGDNDASRLEDPAPTFVLPQQKLDKDYDNDCPMDLSQKESKNDLNFLSKNSEFLLKSKVDADSKKSSSSVNVVPAYLLASITNAGMQHDKMATDLAGSHMLQAYLTAKALHDVKIKQQQNHKNLRSFNENNEPEVESPRQFDKVSHLHQNFCRIYEKTVENDSVNLKRFREEKTFLSVPEQVATDLTKDSQRKRSFELSKPDKNSENCRKLSLGDLNISKFVHDEKTNESALKTEAEDKPDSEKKSEKSDNMSSVTVETSSGKMILVSFPSESERASSPPTGFLSKSTDNKLKAEFFPPSSGPSPSYVSVTEDGRSICVICNKIFTKPGQLRLHVNIHYFERPFRCEACAVSFRTKGHLQKHERSVSHQNKVSMNTTFGTATTSNPRPFKCDDCKIAFRIHGHLAKHLRSKMHIMKLECIGKLPFGTYAEMERSGVNLNEIDTTDCENSLESLQVLAQKLYEKDPSKLGQLENSTSKLNHSTNEEEVTNSERDVSVTEGDTSSSDGYQSSMESPDKHEESNELVCNGRVSIKKEIAHLSESASKGRHKAEKVQKCSVCDERFDNLTSLQVHLFAEHNKDMKMDALNKLNELKCPENVEKS